MRRFLPMRRYLPAVVLLGILVLAPGAFAADEADGAINQAGIDEPDGNNNQEGIDELEPVLVP